eukprot:scaffold41182_cov39-Tisochrysis_lutea.AAC.1
MKGACSEWRDHLEPCASALPVASPPLAWPVQLRPLPALVQASFRPQSWPKPGASGPSSTSPCASCEWPRGQFCLSGATAGPLPGSQYSVGPQRAVRQAESREPVSRRARSEAGGYAGQDVNRRWLAAASGRRASVPPARSAAWQACQA